MTLVTLVTKRTPFNGVRYTPPSPHVAPLEITATYERSGRYDAPVDESLCARDDPATLGGVASTLDSYYRPPGNNCGLIGGYRA